MDNFGDWLDKQLKLLDLSQADLSRTTGITTAHMSRLISGQRKPGNDAILSIARALKIPPEDVFRAAGILPPAIDPNHTPSLGEWMKMFTDADPDTREQLLAMARALSNLPKRKK